MAKQEPEDGQHGLVDPEFRRDVVEGLTRRPRAIQARWFYDRRGSELFEAITELPEYYPTRTEAALLKAIGPELAMTIGPGRAVIEFGSGSSAKTPLLLSAIAPTAYVPIDISGDFLRASARDLAARFPAIDVYPLEANFMSPVTLPRDVEGLAKLGFFPGSTIGNLTRYAAVDLLRTMRGSLGKGAQLLIGIDRVKSADTLVRAYDDADGVTAAFNLNLLERINRELDGDIPIDGFVHEARWNENASRIEMHLIATRDMAFSVDGRNFQIRKGEGIHTENSHKYGARDARMLMDAGGWTVTGEWTAPDDAFALLLGEATERPPAP